MSYKSDMDYYNEQYTKHRKTVRMILKGTVIALAAAVLIAAVGIPISMWANGDFDRSTENEDAVEADKQTKLSIQGPSGNRVTVALGDTIAYKSFVTVVGASGTATLTVNNSGVNTAVPGSYQVVYTATDTAGNQAQYTLTLVISDGTDIYTRERLNNLIATKVQALGITDDMSTVQKVQAVYNYVKDPDAGKDAANIYFSDTSNTPNQNRQNGIRTGWENDWIEEACRTLTMTRMEGDCYTYYSVSKAFFEYLGIENVGIQRSAGTSFEGTHFWQAVNVGTKDAPKWYYYDATRLAGKFSDGGSNSCLITEEKLQSYKTSKNESGFYTFDKNAYRNFPTIATEPLS